MTTRTVREPELPALAGELLAGLRPGAVIWLQGPLGAGKTTLARALVRACGAGQASSPTFALAHRHESSAGPVFHLDCYRLRHAGEAEALEWEAFEQAALLLVEWPERGEGWVPPPDLAIRLAPGPGPDTRQVSWERPARP